MKHIHCTLCGKRILNQPERVDRFGNHVHEECAVEVMRVFVEGQARRSTRIFFDWNLFVEQVREYKRMKAQDSLGLTRPPASCGQQGTGRQHGASPEGGGFSFPVVNSQERTKANARLGEQQDSGN